MNATELKEYRRAHVPVFNDQKMKLGIFGQNCSNGCTISHADTTFEPTYKHSVAISQKADALGFELLVPVGRWRGFGGTTDFNGTCMETYTWATAMATQTEHIMVFSTSHVPTMHPIVAAKQGATIDHISEGRWGLNIVCGWFTPEMEMFGMQQMAHDTRYRYASEWIRVMKRLWSEQHFDHQGEFFTIKDGYLLPKPVQQPYPVIINAGFSPAGRDFSAREADFNFISIDTLENGKAVVTDVKRLAHSYGRDIGLMSYAFVVCRETEKEAHQVHRHIIEKGDWGAARNILGLLGVESGSFTEQHLTQFAENFIAGWGGYPLVGTPEQVTEGLLKLSQIGLDGLILCWLDYHEELQFFGDRVMPLMRQAGLRQ
jgi:dimethylsulfone monooxygenase